MISLSVCTRFLFHEIACETLCKFSYIYAKCKCIFMRYIMINRKLFGIFRLFYHFAANVLSFYFFVSRFSLCLNYSEENKNRNKKAAFCRFCLKTSVFVANKTLTFSDLHLYKANHTPPPPFLALAGWVSSSPKFFIFLFFYFCKILRFYQFRFSTEF